MMMGARPPQFSNEPGSVLESLIVILDRGAVPFCNYVNPSYNSAKPEWMPLEVLKKAVGLAKTKRLQLICLSGKHPVPRGHASVTGKCGSMNIAPLAVSPRMAEAVPVLETADIAAPERSENGVIENAILRLGREEMPQLRAIFNRLVGKVKRINVCLFDIGQYREDDFRLYEEQLGVLAQTLSALPSPQAGLECNLLTDRLVLRGMNNCEAGVKHMTVAPNGRFYLCPGFYYRDEADSVGSLDDGLRVENARLLTLDSASVCRRCDAYHCRRCLFLNSQLTEEINTPSRQQCVAAHLERAASLQLLEHLARAGRLKPAMRGVELPKLDYLDPFELIKREQEGHLKRTRGDPRMAVQIPDGGMEPRGELRALLMEMLAVQKEILIQLHQMRIGHNYEKVEKR